MRMALLSRTVCLIACCAILASCGDSTAPKQPEVTVDMLLQDMHDAGSFGAGMSGAPVWLSVPGTPPSASACPYNASTQQFVCASQTHSGVTTSMYYQLFDASGAPQSAFNALTTASIRTVSDISGTLQSSGTPSPMTIAGHSDHTLSGLLTSAHTLNGGSNTTIETTLDLGGESISSTFTITETTSNLVLPERGSGNRYPKSGSITMTMSSPGEEVAAFQIKITFNGTSTATMEVTFDGETQTCTVDLANPQAVPGCFFIGASN